jgi:hypothetical protein
MGQARGSHRRGRQGVLIARCGVRVIGRPGTRQRASQGHLRRCERRGPPGACPGRGHARRVADRHTGRRVQLRAIYSRAAGRDVPKSLIGGYREGRQPPGIGIGICKEILGHPRRGGRTPSSKLHARSDGAKRIGSWVRPPALALLSSPDSALPTRLPAEGRASAENRPGRHSTTRSAPRQPAFASARTSTA